MDPDARPIGKMKSTMWKRTTEIWNAIVAAVVVIALCGLIAFNLYLFISQTNIVQHQNDTQLCAQHDITVAVKKIGLKLGLPVDDIVPPDVRGIDCEN